MAVHLRSCCDTGRDRSHLFEMVALGAIGEEPFLHYTDADGEEVFVNMEHVTFLQVPSRLVNEGAEEADLEECV